MAKMNIDKSILINKKPEEVFNVLNNFDTWTAWSPWLIMEKGVKVEVREDKKYYEWKGDLTGEGNMTIIGEKPNESIDIDLLFLKPWKSKAKVTFLLKEEGEGTKVHWTMESSLPFFLFWMKKQMEAFIGMDYMRGLEMLKDYLEDGKVHSNLDFKGKAKQEGGKYVGIKTACTIEEMKTKMGADFEKLMALASGPEDCWQHPFSLYHKWDMVGGTCEYTACMPLKEIPADLPAGMITGEIPATDVYTVAHHGAYRHLGNAWSSLYSRQRAKKFKLNKSLSPMEVYLTNPMTAGENEQETEIHFPIKN